MASSYYGTRPNNSKIFSGIFCSNKGDQPIALLDFTHLLPLKVKQNFHVLELFGLIRSNKAGREQETSFVLVSFRQSLNETQVHVKLSDVQKASITPLNWRTTGYNVFYGFFLANDSDWSHCSSAILRHQVESFWWASRGSRNWYSTPFICGYLHVPGQAEDIAPHPQTDIFDTLYVGHPHRSAIGGFALNKNQEWDIKLLL